MPQDSNLVSDAPPPAGLSPLHRLWRWLPANGRRRLLAHAAKRVAPRRNPRPRAPSDGVIIGGEVTRASGLGEAARVLYAACRTMGVPAMLIEAGITVPGSQPDEAVLLHDLAAAPPAAPLILCVNAPQLPAALLRLPRYLLKNRFLIGFWNWELAALPDTWLPALDLVHEIWVPSPFTAKAVAAILPLQSAPILRIIPYPLATVPPQPAPMGRAAFGLPDDAMIVLTSFNLSSSLVRKNPFGAISAFRAAFGNRADCLLVLKVGKSEHYPRDLSAILAATTGAANIRVETRTFPSAERHALTACADIVLSLHRSEGFGLVPAEAMLLGKPVVATNWSGNCAFMDSSTAAMIGYRLIPAVDPRGTYSMSSAVWAEPDINEAAAWLRRLGNDPAARAELGWRGQQAVRSRLGTTALAAALQAIGLTVESGNPL